MSVPRTMHLPCSLVADGTFQTSWRSATQRLNSALADTNPVLLSLAALSPMGYGGWKKRVTGVSGVTNYSNQLN